MRLVVALVVLSACSDDVEVTRLAGSPTATRALTFFDDGTPIAIGGDSEFGLAYLQTPDGDTWKRVADVPAFDAHAKLLRGANDIFAIGETQLYRWDRASGAWPQIAIPFGTTTDTEFGVDDLGHVFALELQPDGAGAVWRWRTDTTRWEELFMTRPIGIGAENFAISPDGNSVAWSVPGVGITRVDLITDTRTDTSCEDPALGACVANVVGLVAKRDGVTALVCDQEPNGLRSAVSITAAGIGRAYELHDAGCRAIATITYGTVMVVGDSLHILQNPDDGLTSITEADPALTYLLRDPSTAFGFGDGIYRIDF